MKKSTILIEGNTYEYQYEGEGIPLFVCGIASYYSATFPEKLKTYFRLVYLDLCWTEEPIGLDYSQITMDSLTDQIEAVREALGYQKIVIFGHSIFALLALAYACKYQRNTYLCVTTAGPARWLDDDIQLAEKYWRANASSERQQIFADNMTALEHEKQQKNLTENELGVKTYLATAPKYWLDPHFDCSYLWEGVCVNRKLLNHFINTIVPLYRPDESYHGLTVPVLAIMGRYDYASPPVLWDGIKDKFCKLRFSVFENSAHYPQLDEPERFTQLLLRDIENVS